MASARLGKALASFALVLLLVGPATAGDRALARFIGFSPDARYFAFEQFGVTDGAGFAYSTVFVLDRQSDSWVVGTPVRVQAESEDTPLAEIRAQAASQAQPVIASMDITTPAELVAQIGDGVPGTDAKTLRFGAPRFVAPGEVGQEYELSLTAIAGNSASPCQDWFGSAPVGYELSLRPADGTAQVLHRDETLPRSRGCPLQYRLYGVVLPFEAETIDGGVAIISVYRGGFEGPDRRFLAVPLRADAL